MLYFFFNDTATTEIYTLSLHDALPISSRRSPCPAPGTPCGRPSWRSEEHTSELQSQSNLVCRLLLEKKTEAASSPAASCSDKRKDTSFIRAPAAEATEDNLHCPESRHA